MDMILHHQYGIADHFTITEGEYENWQAVRPRALSDPFPFAYGEPPLVGGPAVVRFDRRNEKLWYGADGPVRAYTYIPESLPPGTYQLEIPGFRHVLGGARYGRHAMAWFRIGRNPTRFLHTGTLTSGCVTVTWFGRWPDIFRYLMTHRMDSRSVGTIRIFDGRTTREDLRWLAEDRERW
ncbi:MAG: hypothetical protein FJY85_22825 [Deltaproteobacteria bacterium]|nr:hypothetical protein [Deltaproteobacteria bacterium]